MNAFRTLNLVQFEREGTTTELNQKRIHANEEVIRARHIEVAPGALQANSDVGGFHGNQLETLGQVFHLHGHPAFHGFHRTPGHRDIPDARRQAQGDQSFAPARPQTTQKILEPTGSGGPSRAPNEALERQGQVLGGSHSLDFATLGDGNFPSLLGHHQAHGIAALGQPESGRMPGTAAPQAIPIRGEREMNTETQNAIAIHEDAAIVPGRLGIEETENQLLGEASIEMNAPVQVAVQGFAPGQDHEGAHLDLGELKERAHQGALHVGRRMGCPPPESPDRNAFEESPQVLLKDHHQHDGQNSKETLKQARGQLQFETPGQPEQNPQCPQPHQGEPCLGGAKPRNHEPDQAGHDQNVDQIGEPQLGKQGQISLPPPSLRDRNGPGPRAAHARSLSQPQRRTKHLHSSLT